METQTFAVLSSMSQHLISKKSVRKAKMKCFFCLSKFFELELIETSLLGLFRCLGAFKTATLDQSGSNASCPLTAKLCSSCCKIAQNASEAVQMFDMAKLYLSHQLQLLNKILSNVEETEMPVGSEADSVFGAEDNNHLMKNIRNNMRKNCKSRISLCYRLFSISGVLLSLLYYFRYYQNSKLDRISKSSTTSC